MEDDAGQAYPSEVATAVLLAPFSLRTWLGAASVAASVLLGVCLFPVTVAAFAVGALLAPLPRAARVRRALTVRLPARLAAIDRRRLLLLRGTDIGARTPQQGSDSTGQAWYQLIRFPVALVLAALAYFWWVNTLLLLILPFLAQRRFPIVLYGWQFGDVAVSPSGVTAGVVLGIVFVVLGAQVLSAAAAIDTALARALLGPSRESAEIARLTRARAMAVEAAESERRRIERDLHDGFQPRLVSLAAQIGLAMVRFDRDPDGARSMLGQAHTEAKTALADLRGVIRGLHPPVLDERGLDAALSGLIVGCPVPVRVDVSLPQRPDPMREAIAYFVAAEAITNITKHSGAGKAAVTITDAGGPLTILIEDDGRGGAAAVPGGGLTGLAARVAAVDGTLNVTSPPGGPTRVEAVLP
jgi:signal transduction histidine kinase